MASLNETMTTSSRRERVPPLNNEFEALTALREQLEDILKERLDEVEPTKARNLYMQAREGYKEYTKKARNVMRRLNGRGRRNESEDCRADVLAITDNLRGFKEAVNDLLG